MQLAARGEVLSEQCKRKTLCRCWWQHFY